MAAEELEMGRWIRATVMHDAALMGMVSGAYPELIPNDVSLPAVRYDFLQGTDFIVVNGVRIMTTCVFRIVVTGKGPSPAPIVAAVARMDELFRRTQAANATPVITLLSCVRQEPFHFTEVQDQNIFTHVGGLYQLQAQEIG
jgi:hypothetical protein